MTAQWQGTPTYIIAGNKKRRDDLMSYSVGYFGVVVVGSL